MSSQNNLDEIRKNAELKIQTLVYQKRLRIDEFFRDFDTVHNGHVTAPQFRRVLTMLGIDITDTEFESLVKEYSDGTEFQLIQYPRFVDRIDEVFTKKKLEKDPKAKPMDFKPYISTLKKRNELKERQIEFDELLEKIAKFCSMYSYILKACFKDYDKLNHGTVTAAQFTKALPFKKRLSEKELQLLIDRYSNEDGTVNYLLFHEDCEGTQHLQLNNTINRNKKTISNR